MKLYHLAFAAVLLLASCSQSSQQRASVAATMPAIDSAAIEANVLDLHHELGKAIMAGDAEAAASFFGDTLFLISAGKRDTIANEVLKQLWRSSIDESERIGIEPMSPAYVEVKDSGRVAELHWNVRMTNLYRSVGDTLSYTTILIDEYVPLGDTWKIRQRTTSRDNNFISYWKRRWEEKMRQKEKQLKESS